MNNKNEENQKRGNLEKEQYELRKDHKFPPDREYPEGEQSKQDNEVAKPGKKRDTQNKDSQNNKDDCREEKGEATNDPDRINMEEITDGEEDINEES